MLLNYQDQITMLSSCQSLYSTKVIDMSLLSKWAKWGMCTATLIDKIKTNSIVVIRHTLTHELNKNNILELLKNSLLRILICRLVTTTRNKKFCIYWMNTVASKERACNGMKRKVWKILIPFMKVLKRESNLVSSIFFKFYNNFNSFRHLSIVETLLLGFVLF